MFRVFFAIFVIHRFARLVVGLLKLRNRGFRLHLIKLLETDRPSPETVLDLLIPRSFYIAPGLSKHRLGFQVAIAYRKIKRPFPPPACAHPVHVLCQHSTWSDVLPPWGMASRPG